MQKNPFLSSFIKNEKIKFLEGLLLRTKLLIEHKIDGYAIALQSKDGKLGESINSED